MFTLVSLNILVINLVSLPVYVNFAHFFLWVCVSGSCFSFLVLRDTVRQLGSYLLLIRTC